MSIRYNYDEMGGDTLFVPKEAVYFSSLMEPSGSSPRRQVGSGTAEFSPRYTLWVHQAYIPSDVFDHWLEKRVRVRDWTNQATGEVLQGFSFSGGLKPLVLPEKGCLDRFLWELETFERLNLGRNLVTLSRDLQLNYRMLEGVQNPATGNLQTVLLPVSVKVLGVDKPHPLLRGFSESYPS